MGIYLERRAQSDFFLISDIKGNQMIKTRSVEKKFDIYHHINKSDFSIVKVVEYCFDIDWNINLRYTHDLINIDKDHINKKEFEKSLSLKIMFFNWV